MNHFRRLAVGAKLLVSFCAVLSFIVVLGITAVVDLGNMTRNTGEITDQWMPRIARLNQIDTVIANLRIQELRAATASAADDLQRHLAEADSILAELAKTMPAYENLISGRQERALWDAYTAEWQPYLALHTRMVGLLAEHKQAEALALLGADGKQLYDAGRVALEADLKFNTAGAGAATDASRSIAGTARVLIVVLVLVAVVLGLTVAIAMARSIRRPLEQVIQLFHSIASGKLDNPIDTSGRDEMGQVFGGLSEMQLHLRKLLAEMGGQLQAIGKAQAVIEFQLDGTIITANEHFLNAMGYSLEQIRGQHHSLFVEPSERASVGYQQFWEKLRRGEYDKARYLRVGQGGRKVWIDASYNPILDADGKPQKIVKYANDVTAHVVASQQMQKAVAQTQEVIKAASEGNLTVRVGASEQTGDLRKMADSINMLLASMSEMVRKVKIAASEVSRGAEEISQGNTNLSQRTEEQASSLEETASSMEEMTTTVKCNADNAAQANQLAAAARDLAEQGGKVTGQGVRAMTEINEASRRIADIIGVIDEIAFQTNLLALNAAVEAARAGEQGRGFAVVASEVRTLAGRSATAARQIKELIQDSVKKVEDGSVLVTESGHTLEEIVISVKKVTDIVAEIAAASREQSSGIEQVNRAVMQMDQTTQQNAALVEQATAASQSMAEQARGLDVMMAAFRVDESSSGANIPEPIRDAAVVPTKFERRGPQRAWAGQRVDAGGVAAPQATPDAQPSTEWHEF